MPAGDTDALLKNARSGDAVAMSQLLDRHRDRLRQMVRVRMDERLLSRIDPSDVVQETMAAAIKRLPEYLEGPPLPFYPWLRQIAYDRLIDLFRRHIQADKRTVTREEQFSLSASSAAQLASQLIASGGEPISRLLRQELLARTRAALTLLSESDREIILLRHLEQLDTSQTAEMLGISESAAKLRLLRAVRRLRELLHGDSSSE